MLLQTGVRPGDTSIFKLYKYMISKPDCGGICGEMEIDFYNEEGSLFLKYAEYFE